MVRDEHRVTDLSAVSGMGKGGDVGWRVGRRSEGGLQQAGGRDALDLGDSTRWQQAWCSLEGCVAMWVGNQEELMRVTQTKLRGALSLRSMGGSGCQAWCSSLPALLLWVKVPSLRGGSVCPSVNMGSEP